MTCINSFIGVLLLGIGRLATATSACSATVTSGHSCTKTSVSVTLKAATPDECCAFCAARQRIGSAGSGCVQWTFKGGNKCLLTNVSQPIHSHSGATCGIMSNGPSPSPAPVPPPPPPSPSPSPSPMPPSSGLHGPDPSFHTIPVVSHSFYGKKKIEPWPRPAALIANLSKFRMVVIEKFEGPCWAHCFVHPTPNECVPSCDVARYQLGTARALKAANPRISMIIYLNSVMLFPMYSYVEQFWGDAPAQPLLLRDAKTGNIGHIQNDAGLGNLTVPNWGLPKAVDLMVQTVVNLTSGERGRGAFDGIFSGSDIVYVMPCMHTHRHKTHTNTRTSTRTCTVRTHKHTNTRTYLSIHVRMHTHSYKHRHIQIQQT